MTVPGNLALPQIMITAGFFPEHFNRVILFMKFFFMGSLKGRDPKALFEELDPFAEARIFTTQRISLFVVGDLSCFHGILRGNIRAL